MNCPATAAALDAYLSSGEVHPAAGGSGLATYPFVSNPMWSAPTPNIANIRSMVSRERFVVVEGTRPHDWAEANHVTDTHYFVIVNHRGTVYVVEPQGGLISSDVAGYVRQQGFATYRYAQQQVVVGPPNDLDLSSDLPPGAGEL